MSTATHDLLRLVARSKPSGEGARGTGEKKKKKKGEGTAEHKQEGSSLLSMRMQFEPRILVKCREESL